MKRLFFAGVVLFAVFMAVFRQRIFLRDPLGKVERNGVTVEGARLYINYSNGVLVQETDSTRFVLVQGWSHTPGVPQHLACITMLSCWTDADQAAVFPLSGSARNVPAAMSSKEVTFVDGSGEDIRVQLR